MNSWNYLNLRYAQFVSSLPSHRLETFSRQKPTASLNSGFSLLPSYAKEQRRSNTDSEAVFLPCQRLWKRLGSSCIATQIHCSTESLCAASLYKTPRLPREVSCYAGKQNRDSVLQTCSASASAYGRLPLRCLFAKQEVWKRNFLSSLFDNFDKKAISGKKRLPLRFTREICSLRSIKMLGLANGDIASTTQVPRFWNQCFDKGRLKNFVLWFFFNYGESKTVELLENLKSLGFEYATKAGVSLGIDDLKIPPKKAFLIAESEKQTSATIKKFKRGEMTGVERFQKLIDTWHRTSENLKQEVIDHFKATDILNPVYMMAFSGARGNISQVRQLVGMRGLMADPQGQILDFPIRSNFREGLTLTEYIISSYGARKGIVDTALRTANAGYLTRRLVDVAQHVIVAQFDCGTTKGLFLSDMKEGNKTIYSLQNRLVGRVLAKSILTPVNTATPSLLALDSAQHYRFAALRNRNKKSSVPSKYGRNTTKVKTFLEQTKEGPKVQMIAERNLEISTDLAAQISQFHQRVFVRSPLTCETRKFVCQLCYGWNLSQGNLVSIGEAVGIIAAQSIGEPGTQLTMRTFHTGGVFSGDITEQIKAPHNGIVLFQDSIPGTIIRTSEGKIAFLTKSEGVLKVRQGSKEFTSTDADAESLCEKSLYHSYKIPSFTILFVRNGERISENQVIAQLSTLSRNQFKRNEVERSISAEIDGEVYFSSFNANELLSVFLYKKHIGDEFFAMMKTNSFFKLNYKERGQSKKGTKQTTASLSLARSKKKKQEPKETASLSGVFEGTLDSGKKKTETKKAKKKAKKEAKKKSDNIAKDFKKLLKQELIDAPLKGPEGPQRSYMWTSGWVLSGKIYQSPIPSQFFPLFGDFINHTSMMNSVSWNIYSHGAHFAQLDPIKTKFSQSVFLKKKLVFFPVQKFYYKKVGYFFQQDSGSSFYLPTSFSGFFSSQSQEAYSQIGPGTKGTESLEPKATEKKNSEIFLQWFPKQSQTNCGGFFFFEMKEFQNQFLKRILWIPTQFSYRSAVSFEEKHSPIKITVKRITKQKPEKILQKSLSGALIKTASVKTLPLRSSPSFPLLRFLATSFVKKTLDRFGKTEEFFFIPVPGGDYRFAGLLKSKRLAKNYRYAMTQTFSILNFLGEEKNKALKNAGICKFSREALRCKNQHKKRSASIQLYKTKKETPIFYVPSNPQKALTLHKKFFAPGEKLLDDLLFGCQTVYVECFFSSSQRSGRTPYETPFLPLHLRSGEAEALEKSLLPRDSLLLKQEVWSKKFQLKNYVKNTKNRYPLLKPSPSPESSHLVLVIRKVHEYVLNNPNEYKRMISQLNEKRGVSSLPESLASTTASLISGYAGKQVQHEKRREDYQKRVERKNSTKAKRRTGVSFFYRYKQKCKSLDSLDSYYNKQKSTKETLSKFPNADLKIQSQFEESLKKSNAEVSFTSQTKVVISKPFNLNSMTLSYSIPAGLDFSFKTPSINLSIQKKALHRHPDSSFASRPNSEGSEGEDYQDKKAKSQQKNFYRFTFFSFCYDFYLVQKFLQRNIQFENHFSSVGTVGRKPQETQTKFYVNNRDQNHFITSREPIAKTSYLSPFDGEIVKQNEPKNQCLILTQSDQMSFHLKSKSKNPDSANLQKESSGRRSGGNDGKSSDQETTAKFGFNQSDIYLKSNKFKPKNALSGRLLITKNYRYAKNQTLLKIQNLKMLEPTQSNHLVLGDFFVPGDKITKESQLCFPKGGQVIHIGENKMTLRNGQPIFLSSNSILHSFNGDFVAKNTPVITLPFQVLTTGDIVQGIPKIEQFFEARSTKNGRFFKDSIPNLLAALFKHYKKKLTLHQAVQQSFYKIQQIIVDGVQRVYRSQGVTISDKHLEIIVKQMTAKVLVVKGGQTGFLPGEILDLDFVETINPSLIKKIRYKPIVLGITKASLEVDSFLSAASFQQTTRVLSRAAISKQKDFLKGVKENVIVGNIIPAGTGYFLNQA